MPNPKVLIENQNALGRNVEQVTLDSNRINTQRETISRFSNFIAISSRGLWIDTSQWVAYSAGFFSLVKLALLSPSVPLWAILLGAGLPMWVFSVMIVDACDRRKTLRLHAVVRFFLLVIGGAIAIA